MTDPARPLLERAIRELRRLRADNDRLRPAPIAIVGMACRFPGGADDPDAFWDLLARGADTITEIPASRWPVAETPPGARWAGLLRGPLADFDADYFNLSPREAASLDPQQRLLLEVASESLADAALAQGRLPRRGGVFIGLANLDYRELVDARPQDVYSATGNLHSTAAGRLSHALDLHGPSVAVDTACSSSLVAVHLARRSLQQHECDVALAGGVQLLLSPRTTDKVATTLGLAPDGRCRAFDARAAGLVRAEGCGVLVLRRLADAQRDGDAIRGVLRGSAVHHNGHTLGLTAASPLAQERLLAAALADAGLTADDITCIEAMAAASPLADAIEFEALHAVYGARTTACAVASLKTGFGHMEAASGVAAIIKTILALEHEQVPAHLHLAAPNPRLRLAGSRLHIPTRPHAWPRAAAPRRAAVSAFGIAGTLAHLILEEAPPPRTAAVPDDGRAVLLPISARSPAALAALLDRHRERLADEHTSLPDLAHTLAVGRDHEPHRRALVGRTRRDLLTALATPPPPPLADRPPIVLLCPASSHGWPGLGARLIAEEPAFRDALAACAAALRLDAPALLEPDLLPEPAVWALTLALAAVWRAWGVVADDIVGHGVGALAAAHLTGALSLADAAAAVLARQSDLSQKTPSLSPKTSTANLSPETPNLSPETPTPNLSPETPNLSPETPLSSLLATLPADAAIIALGTFPAAEDLDPRLLAPLRPHDDEPVRLRHALAALYVAGHPVTWAHPDGARRRVRLPAYPWQRERAWLDPIAPTPAPPEPTTTPTPITKPAPTDQHDLIWRPAPRPPSSLAVPTLWISAEDPHEAAALARELPGATIDDLTAAPPPHRLDAILVLLADRSAPDPAAAAATICQRLTALVRATLHRGDRDPPRLYIATRGATDGARPEHAAAWGYARALMHEHPALRCTLLDLAPRLAVTDLAAELTTDDPEDQRALRPGERLVARLVRADRTAETTPAAGRSFRLESDHPGLLDHLQLRAHPRTPPAPGHLEIAVEAAGLNFLDVLRALAAIDADDAPLGVECVGTVTAVGDGVTDLQPGDRVLALADGAFASHVHAARPLVAAVPPGLTSHAAATLPLATLTAWYALHHVARLQPGERVLIHAAAGGVGQAAVQIALARGAEVFATAGTAAKRAMLVAQGVHHVASSRDRSFVAAFERATGSTGVDVVLNSLAGELLEASLGLLRADGRFIEIGKRDYQANHTIGLAPFLRRLTWSLVDLRAMMRDPPRLGRLLAEVAALWTSGAVRPLAHQIFPIQSAADAFAAMARGDHTGKLVLDLTAPADLPLAPPSALHLAPAGLVLLTSPDPLALRLALHLCDHGATHLAVLLAPADLSQETPDLSPETAAALAALQRRADVQLLVPDPSAADPLAAAVAALQAPLAAIVHVSPRRPPTPLLRLAAADQTALAARLRAAWQLDALAAAHPETRLIVCTSADTTLGAAGHALDAAVDAVLAALARRADRRDVVCLELADDHPDPPAALADLLTRGVGHGLATRLHVRRWRETHLARAGAPLLADLHDTTTTPAPLRARLLAAAPETRLADLHAAVADELAHVLRRPAERLGPDVPLQQLGLDSLTALELRNRLEAALDLALSPAVIWHHPTLRTLTRHLHDALGPAAPAPAPEPTPPEPEPEPGNLAAFLAAVTALAAANPDDPAP